jgi:hypothetical protein
MMMVIKGAVYRGRPIPEPTFSYPCPSSLFFPGGYTPRPPDPPRPRLFSPATKCRPGQPLPDCLPSSEPSGMPVQGASASAFDVLELCRGPRHVGHWSVGGGEGSAPKKEGRRGRVRRLMPVSRSGNAGSVGHHDDAARCEQDFMPEHLRLGTCLRGWVSTTHTHALLLPRFRSLCANPPHVESDRLMAFTTARLLSRGRPNNKLDEAEVHMLHSVARSCYARP